MTMYDRLTARPATVYTPPEDLVDEAHRFDHLTLLVEDEHSHGGTPSLNDGCV